MAGLSLVLVAAVVGVTWVVLRPVSEVDPYVAPVPSEKVDAIDAPGAAAALQQLVSAIASSDRDAAVKLASRDDSKLQDRLGDLVDVAQEAAIDQVRFRYLDDLGGPAADGTWAATVDAAWAYSNFDVQPTETEISVRFRKTSAGVVIAGIGGAGLRTPVWMTGAMQVSRSRDLLVVAAAGTDLDAYVRLARSAMPVVTGFLTRWRPRLVIEVPASGEVLEEALGTEPGYYSQIAAVTGTGGELEAQSPFHVLINPDVFSGLGRAGRQVVLAHEATHVATAAPRSAAPPWLIEGFADYVALRGSNLPLRRTAAQIARQVGSLGLPSSLPTAADFDTRGPGLGAVYESSWLLCETLARIGGERSLRTFYTKVSAGRTVEAALAEEFGVSTADLVDRWRETLRRLPTAAAG